MRGRQGTRGEEGEGREIDEEEGGEEREQPLLLSVGRG